MTTYTGNDVDVEFDIAGAGAQKITRLVEASLEIDNGRYDVKVIGYDTIQEFGHTFYDISGSISVIPQAPADDENIDNWMDLVYPDATGTGGNPAIKDLVFKFGTTPDYTFTLTDVGFGSLSFDTSLDEPVTFEMPFVAKSLTIT